MALLPKRSGRIGSCHRHRCTWNDQFGRTTGTAFKDDSLLSAKLVCIRDITCCQRLFVRKGPLGSCHCWHSAGRWFQREEADGTSVSHSFGRPPQSQKGMSPMPERFQLIGVMVAPFELESGSFFGTRRAIAYVSRGMRCSASISPK